MSVLRSALIALAIAGIPSAASAQFDVRLSGFLDQQGGQIVKDIAGFEALAEDLTQLLGPKMLGPIRTSGGLGFDVGLDIAVAPLNLDLGHWQKASGSDVPDVATALQLQFRKGLPFGFELGGMVSHLVDSELWGIGMNVGWAFTEGYQYVPDMGLRAWVSTALGSRDMAMLIVGADVTVSKAFGIAGLFSLEPYIGYSLLYGRISPYVIAFFPNNQPQLQREVFAPHNAVLHRGAIGIQANIAHATIAFEAMLSADLAILTTRIGASF